LVQLGYAKAHHTITPIGKSGCGLGLGSSPEFWGSPIIFLQRLKLGFAMAHHKIPHRRKSGRGPGLEELPKILGFLFNICAAAESSNFKFGMQLGFAKAHHETTPRGKVRVSLG